MVGSFFLPVSAARSLRAADSAKQKGTKEKYLSDSNKPNR
ncbi:MAG: hypothetical protein [Podoviridae sp. ctLUJ1]|nr:MAG: hypothetical protein [Podoviridae sp. ctLUJ1]